MNGNFLGSLLVDIEGTKLSLTDQQLLQHPAVGGVVLFDRNCYDATQVAQLCEQIHGLRGGDLLITIDQEGGKVQRLRRGVTRLPQFRMFGYLYDEDPMAAQKLAHDVAWLMASELLNLGVDLSFSPVLDLGFKSEVIGTRAFHRNPQTVADLGISWIDGMHEAGMAAVGKHFPGHGGVVEDSHYERPVDPRDMTGLLESDGLPFRRVVTEGIDAIMMSHVVYNAVAPHPASLSPFWIREVLRKNFGFSGVVVADDLSMNALADVGDLRRRLELALAAGCDLLPLCNNRSALLDMLAEMRNPEGGSDLTNRRELLRANARSGFSIDGDRRERVREQIERLNLRSRSLGALNAGE